MSSGRYAAGPNAPLPPHLDPRGRHRGGHASRLHKYSIVGGVLAALLSATLLVAAGYYWLTYRSIDSGVHRLRVALNAPPSGKHDADGSDQNILLVGIDDRTKMTQQQIRQLKVGNDGGSMNTDTMMILHVPADGSKATFISLPRDSYVKIPGHGMNKLNAAFVAGYNAASGTPDQKRTAGANLLIQTIQNLTGLTINHYVQISFIGFYDISNAIGGVHINLCHAVNDTVAYNRSIGSDGGSGFHMSAGPHTIKGVTALEFVRQRHNLPNGDLDRVRRQQYFLTAAFRQVASVGIFFKLNSLGDALQKDVYMDPGLHLLDLAHQMENLNASNIIGKTIPFEHFATESVGSVEIVNPAQVQRFVAKLIAPQSSTSPSPSTSAGTKKAGTSKSARPSSSTSAKALDSKCVN